MKKIFGTLQIFPPRHTPLANKKMAGKIRPLSSQAR
jgi:hypothetical protein